MKKIKVGLQSVFYLSKPYWQYGKLYMLISVIAATVLLPLGNILNVYFHKTVIDAIVDGNIFTEILLIIAFFEISKLIIFMLNDIISDLFLTIQYEKVSMKLNRDIFVRAVKTDYRYFDNAEFYQNYTWTLSEFNRQSLNARSFILQILTSLMTITAMVSIIAATDVLIIFITVITLAISTFIGVFQNKIWFKRRDEMMSDDRRISYIQRTFYINTYAADLKSNNVKDYLFENYDKSVNNKINIVKKYAFQLLSLAQLQSFTRNTLNFIIVAYIGYRIVNGEISIGNFAGMIAASASLQNSLGNFFGLINQANQLSIYANKIKEFFDLKSDIENSSYTPSAMIESSEPFNIDIRNVNFKYENSNFALKNINMRIKKGEKIAIVGENGGGKSTLTKLLLRLYDVSSGDIFINGMSIRDYNISEFRKHVGIAFQNTLIYAMTLRENMQLYHKTSDEKLHEIIETTGLMPIFTKSKGDLDTQITREFDNDGMLLSGGEIQKLGLSRLFTGEFGLILLDEPSSSLDPIAEYELNKIIFDRQLTTTTIIISHRLSTIRDADCIYLVDNGTISESGTHEQLMHKKGKYYTMFTKQAEKYIKE